VGVSCGEKISRVVVVGSALDELPGTCELFHRFSVLNLSDWPSNEFSFHRFLPNVKWMSQSKGEQHGQDGEKLLANGEQTASERIPSNYGENPALRAYQHLLCSAAALPAMRWRTVTRAERELLGNSAKPRRRPGPKSIAA